MTVELIECGETFGIADAKALYPKLLTHLLEEKHVTFDCSDIERIDTAALQLLYAFSQAALQYGSEVNWGKASETFVTNARLIGVASAMGIANNNEVEM